MTNTIIETKVSDFITATNTNGSTGLALIHETILHAFDNRGETSQLYRLCFDLSPSDNSRMKKILSATVTDYKLVTNKETGEKRISFKGETKEGKTWEAKRIPDAMLALDALIKNGEGFRNASVKDALFPSASSDAPKVTDAYLNRIFKLMDKEGYSLQQLVRHHAAVRVNHPVVVAVPSEAA